MTVEKLKEQSPEIYPAEFMGTRGNVTTKHWALEYGKVIMSQTVKWTWTDPPAVILPDQTVALTFGCEVVANGPKPPRRHLIGAIGADLAGYKVPQQYMGMGNFFDKNDPRKYQIGVDQGTAPGKTVMTATKIVPGPFDLALEQKTPPVGRTIRVFVTHGARWVYSYNYLWVGGTPPSGAGRTTTSESTKVLPAGGKTSWGTIYPKQSEGDVFQGGRWCNAKNGSDWLQRDFDGVYEISEIHIARAGTDVTTKGSKMVLKLQQPNGQWITVDELRETNVNFDKLSYGGKGNSIPAYQKLLPTPIAAKAFRLEFTGNGWFVAGDIKLLGRK